MGRTVLLGAGTGAGTSLVAAATVALSDIALAVAAGWAAPASYFAFTALLLLVVAAVSGGLGSAAAVALAIGLGAGRSVRRRAAWFGPALGAGAALWLQTGWDRRPLDRPDLTGLPLALGPAVVLVVWGLLAWLAERRGEASGTAPRGTVPTQIVPTQIVPTQIVPAGIALGAAVALPGALLAPVLRTLGWIDGGRAGPREAVVTLLVVGVLLVVGGLLAGLGSRPGRVARGAAAVLGLVLVVQVAAPWIYTALQRRPVSVERLEPVPAPGGIQPSILVLVLDTVRADRLGLDRRPAASEAPAHHGEDLLAPRLARRVAAHPGALSFTRAFAPGTWTIPSHASLFTGLLPSEHGAHFRPEHFRERRGFSFPLGARTTLAEALRAEGYRTVLVHANPLLGVVPGLARGFERVDKPDHPASHELLLEIVRDALVPGVFPEASLWYPEAPAVSSALLDHLEGCAPERPCFAVANYMEAHAHYVPGRPERGLRRPWGPFERPGHLIVDEGPGRLALLGERYRETLLTLDREIDALLDRLEERGLLDHTWVVLTADHGEAWLEHGVTEHGTGVHQEQSRVPLVVLPPRDGAAARGPARWIDEPVGLIDAAATVAALGGTTVGRTAAGEASRAPGRDLRRVAADPLALRAPVQVQFFGDPDKAKVYGEAAALPGRAVVLGSWALVTRTGTGRVELYDLATDPAQARDVAGEHPEIVTALHRLLAPMDGPRAPGGDDLDDDLDGDGPTPEELDALRALGYVQ